MQSTQSEQFLGNVGDYADLFSKCQLQDLAKSCSLGLVNFEPAVSLPLLPGFACGIHACGIHAT